MKLIVGLGNPGKEYLHTPHNAGFVAIDVLHANLTVKGLLVDSWQPTQKEKAEIAEVFDTSKGKIAVLAKPTTFMNLSGGAVQQLMQKYGIKNQEDVLIIYDELDIKLGEFKYSPLRNSPTHKGIGSIMSTVGKGVHSLRIGVDNRVNRVIPGMDYVLRPYNSSEQVVLQGACERALLQHVYDFLGLL